jgi:transposase
MAGVGQLLEEVERLRALLAERDTQLTQQAEQLADQTAQIAALTVSNEELAQRLALLRRKLFGRKNERYTADDQEMLPFVPLTPTPPPRLPKPESDTEDAKPKGRGKPKRRDLSALDHLPMREMPCRRDPDATCGRCGGELKDIGVAVSWRLEWVPGHFERLKVSREKCACPRCPSEGVLVAPEPSFAIRYGLPGNGLLAQVLVDKFADRIPLNLQKARMKRVGVDIATSTMSGWVGHSASTLRPIVDAVIARLLQQGWLQGDDTGMPVQDGTDGALRKGRLWAYTDQQEVAYAFTDDKSGEGPAQFLAGFQGKLLLFDGGSEFNLAARELDIERAGCFSHLRRYFFDARLYHPVQAHLALGTIRDLFALEAGVWGGPREAVREVRDRDARPLVDGLFDWIRGISTTVRPSSLLGEAITYALNQEPALRAFLDHPEIPMHNNRSELMLRGPVVGRKAWLFAGSEGGAEAAATIFTLVGSCMLQGIDPWAYLFDVLNRLPDHPASRLEELTPRGWRLAREV